jgi:predicted PurR-regulated permease PerM
MFRVDSQLRFWTIVLLVFAAIIWLLKAMLLPFIIGMLVAYFLNPVVDGLSRHKVPRWISSLAVLGGFVLFVALLLVLILPILETQIGALLGAIPDYLQRVRDHSLPWIENWLSQFEPEDVQKLRDAAGQSVGNAAALIGNLFKNIVSTSFALLDIVALMIVTPVVAFYMLNDWPRITSTIDSLFPQRYYDVIHSQLREIDTTLSGFLRGQAIVCLILGCYYSLGLTLAGLKYGAVIGIVAGVLTFIPYVGTSFGWISSLFLAMAQFDNNWSRIIPVIGVFFVGHILETYVLTPRFVGHRVNLHPVWILFALLAGASLMGFTGVLLAVPVAAVLGVLIRFAVRQYRASPIYKDIL